MSWDVFIQHLPSSAVHVADIPDDFEPLPLGTRADVMKTVATVFASTDMTDPTWIKVSDQRYAIEIGVGDEDPVACVALHVRGDESVIPPIARLVELFGARAIDSWTGEFFETERAAESIRQWRAFVDQL
ncbi:MAG TPA: hypothetical protein VF618_04935 [Thermoanaerobaculia bacterium]